MTTWRDEGGGRRAEISEQGMERNLLLHEQLGEEDYIDMDISSSPARSREFEFQKGGNPLHEEFVTSPADELFYKGNLLPLHLPPRLQMVEKLVCNSPKYPKPNFYGSFHLIPNGHSATTTPFDSCTISPSCSCYVSQELDPGDYFFQSNAASIETTQTENSWLKKLKSIRQSSLGSKLKASTAYLKSLFTKSPCSDDSSTAPKAKECSHARKKPARRNPFGARNFNGEKKEGKEGGHRRSFSDAIKKQYTPNKSSSASSSCSSSNSSSFSTICPSGPQGQQMSRRSSSASSDLEKSIQGAIAHCKKSLQSPCRQNNVCDAELCSLSVSRLAEECDEMQGRPGICRG
ncbi:hypothetical protein HPP92_017406 [Vanilla planifolia]|uniref:Membrane-associated kinase regulator 4 n=1 Tax=Vanilla planifolia TaxID=51239 RepID=A0A835QG05_VANPL|nr:hypothetical protein HPP92_017406 [Vanilla planifolia]